MTNKTTRKSIKPSSNKVRSKKKASSPPAKIDQSVRDHVLYLLKDGGAHVSFAATVADWPLQLVGVRVASFPHTAWMLLEHMRLAQWDILEFSRNRKHVSSAWPEGYWPASEKPQNEKAWTSAIAAFKKDLRTMQQLVSDPRIDLFAKIPWGDGQTVLREALLLADHNAYHLGQLAMLRKSIGV